MILNQTFGKGATFTPSVSQNGDLSWTNDGGLANPAPVNIRGPVGPRGKDGAQGPQGPAGPSFTRATGGELYSVSPGGENTINLPFPAKVVFLEDTEKGVPTAIVPGTSVLLTGRYNAILGTVSLSYDGLTMTVSVAENEDGIGRTNYSAIG